MSGRKRLAIVLSVLGAGIGTALVFRKDASRFDFRQDAVPESPFRERVERRALADTAWIRNLSRGRAKSGERPAERILPTPASITQAALPPAQPTFQKSFSPVSALLYPIDGVPADEQVSEIGAGLDPPSAPGTLIRTGALQHRIVDGDTLSQLAQTYLGRSDRYLEIFEANRDLLASPDLLPIGAMLKIPPRQLGAESNHLQPPSRAAQSGSELQLLPSSGG